MKRGSADDPFADDPIDGEAEDESEAADQQTAQDSRSSAITDNSAVHPEDSSEEDNDSSRSTFSSLPYIYARNSVKDGRQQRPIFLRDEVEDGIPELVKEMESIFGEDVYRTDVLEAAVVVAQQNPTLVKETLEEWGYGWD